VGLRFGIEIRRSSGTLASLLLALTCYGVAVAVHVGWLPLPGELGWHALVTATLLGHVGVWLATLSYAQHVYLEAQGLLAATTPRAKAKRKTDTPADKASSGSDEPASASATEKSAVGRQLRVDAAHGESSQKPASSGGPLKGAMISSASVRSDSDNDSADRKLSKAERKRLRRTGRLDTDDE
jgi:hypothetical protein